MLAAPLHLLSGERGGASHGAPDPIQSRHSQELAYGHLDWLAGCRTAHAPKILGCSGCARSLPGSNWWSPDQQHSSGSSRLRGLSCDTPAKSDTVMWKQHGW